MSHIYYGNSLYHHGILGQKWGKRNGPPYPLGKEDYSKAEKDAAKKNFSLSDKQKKYIKIGAALAVTALAAYGGYKIYQNRGMIQNYARLGKKNVDFIRNSGKFDYLNTSNDLPSNFGANIAKNVGNGFSKLEKGVFENINKSNFGTKEGQINCTHCSISYVLNSMFGIKCTALGFDGIDEKSGMVTNYRNGNIILKLFDNVVKREYIDLSKTSSQLVFDSIKNNSSGCIGLFDKLGAGHMINYERDSKGTIRLLDSQNNLVIDLLNPAHRKWFDEQWDSKFVTYDMSNSSVNLDAVDLFERIISI